MSGVAAVHFKIFCCVYEDFIYRIDMDVVFIKILKIYFIYLRGVFHIEFHPRRSFYIWYALRYFKEAAPVFYSHLLEGRSRCKAYCLFSSFGVGYH